MTAIEDLMRTALFVDEARKAAALRVLRGEAEAFDQGELQRRFQEESGPLLLGMSAAAAYLGVSRPTLWRLIQAGRVEKVELYAKSFRIRRADLDAILKRSKKKTAK